MLIQCSGNTAIFPFFGQQVSVWRAIAHVGWEEALTQIMARMHR
ncbi:hypothetical protein [Okeania sp. SIO3B5]|nr:hypothetical protein [Okeania sp. SIO3B5]